MITKISEDYIKALLQEDKRIDGRKLDEMRNVKVISGVSANADGSAKVLLGDTQILVGVKLELGEPFPDTPDEGVLIVNAELPPLASPDFEPGPPKEEAIELARVIDRGIRESKCLDMESLCIKREELAWLVFVDIIVINHGGNLIDAAALGAIAALLNAKVPKMVSDEKVPGEWNGKLLVRQRPVACTVVKIGDKLLVDPDLREEAVLDARLTITTIQDSICAMQLGGNAGFNMPEIERALELAKAKTTELRKLLPK